jgi:hypothetical protein
MGSFPVNRGTFEIIDIRSYASIQLQAGRKVLALNGPTSGMHVETHAGLEVRSQGRRTAERGRDSPGDALGHPNLVS